MPPGGGVLLFGAVPLIGDLAIVSLVMLVGVAAPVEGQWRVSHSEDFAGETTSSVAGGGGKLTTIHDDLLILSGIRASALVELLGRHAELGMSGGLER